MAGPVIVFAGAVYPGQFGLLCDHLRASGLAETFFFTTPGHRERNLARGDHLRSFQPDGPIVGPQGYYYSAKAERSARIGRGLLAALRDFERERRIDVVVAHSLWGAPHFLYDEIDAAIVSYVEFPSYRAHGWDPAYPPDLAQRLADRNMEMLHFHQVLKSDLTIVPSHHAKSMFPAELRGRIEVQFEGFDVAPPAPAPRPPDALPVIGFAARDLSSAKGIDVYIRLVERLLAEGVAARFVAMGDAEAPTYGYEAQWVQRTHGGEVKSFRDHLLRLHPRAAGAIEFTGKLPYAEFAERVAQVDLFLYPLRFGVANWGLMEILARGGCVIAPRRGYAPELVAHDVNGWLEADDDDAWIAAIKALLADPPRRRRYAEAARETGRSFHVSATAPRYMRLFRHAMDLRAQRIGNAG
ncbi:MAG: glycosyltransferase [Comamonadaceae bacterium]|nr:MAG: glycosyltransferase [Comamonadaceae bacterium]